MPKKITTKTPKEQTSSQTKSVAKTANSMEELLKKNVMHPPKKGTEIKAKIITLGKRQMIFDIGWKSYAVLGELETKELSTYLPYIHTGDELSVNVVVEESKEGFPVVSMRKFFEKGKWEILEQKQKNEEEIEVICGEYGKGGIFVDFMGIRGVIPKIQLTEDFIASPDKLYGQKIKVKVLEVDKEKNRLVVSQKAVALGISYKDLKKDFDTIKVGETYKAKVIGFSDFGVFCEINKIEGLIHISEISWSKVSDPTKDIQVDDEVDVVVVEKNEANFKLNLSIKRLTPDPWKEVEKKYPLDKQIPGEVIRKERYGYIVRIEEGIEGLIHVSKLAANEELKIGQKVSVYVEKIDTNQRRMSLIMSIQEKPLEYR
jgi:ribosomal protein S1